MPIGHHRPEEDQEVEEEEERQDDELPERSPCCQRVESACGELVRRLAPGQAVAEEVEHEPRERDEHDHAATSSATTVRQKESRRRMTTSSARSSSRSSPKRLGEAMKRRKIRSTRPAEGRHLDQRQEQGVAEVESLVLVRTRRRRPGEVEDRDERRRRGSASATGRGAPATALAGAVRAAPRSSFAETLVRGVLGRWCFRVKRQKRSRLHSDVAVDT